jgi:hypothetical protein
MDSNPPAELSEDAQANKKGRERKKKNSSQLWKLI